MMDLADLMQGACMIGPVYSLCALLAVLVPGKTVVGYACDRQGKPLKYKLNGLYVLVIVVVCWALLAFPLGMLRPEAIAESLWEALLVANLAGLAGSLWMYLQLTSWPLDI